MSVMLKNYDRRRRRYIFKGAAINQFGNVLDPFFTAQTIAMTEQEAKRNVTAQFKKKHGLEYSACIRILGKMTCVS